MIDPIAHIKQNVSEDKWIIFEDANLKIIDQDLFDRTQAEINRRSKPSVRQSCKYLLSNILYCSCGSGMTRKKIKAYTRLDGTSNDLGYEWTCTKRDQKGLKGCDKQFRNSVKEEYAIDFIKEELRRWQSDDTAQNLTTEYYFYQQINLSEDQKELIPEIKTQIQTIQTQISKNIELLAAGVITMETFKQFSEGKNIKLNELLHELQRITNLENEREEINHRRDQFIQQVRQLNIDNLTNSTLKQIFTKIIVHRDENEVILIPIYNLGVKVDWQKAVEAIVEETKSKLLAEYGC